MRSKIIKELETELKMRRKVWPRIFKENEKFLKIDHQERYELLKYAKRIFEEMSDTDFAKIYIKIDTQPNNEPTLF